MNQVLSEGTLNVLNPESSPYSEEATDLVWYVRPNGTRVESPKQSNDVCDATLYAYKEAYHYMFVAEPVPPKPGTPEFYQAEVNRMEQAVLDAWEENSQRGTEW
jgi:hypothetical protein